MLYFDANANYPVSEKVKKAYCEALHFGNVSATPTPESTQTMADLRAKTLYQCGAAQSSNFVLTSGASESNATIIHNVMMSRPNPSFLVSKTAHASVTQHLSRLAEAGLVKVFWMEDGIPTGFDCLFVQSVCSETGNIAPMDKLARLAKSKGALLAIDHVQGFMKIPCCPATFIGGSYHKIGAPIGLGFLIVDEKAPFVPLIGGKQNNGMRGGTYNYGAIKSALVALNQFKFIPMADAFLDELEKHIPVVAFGNPLPPTCFVVVRKTPNTGNVVFGSFMVNGEPQCGGLMKAKLLKRGIIIATGSACNSESNEDDLGSVRSLAKYDSIKKGFIRVSFHQWLAKSDLRKLAAELLR